MAWIVKVPACVRVSGVEPIWPDLKKSPACLGAAGKRPWQGAWSARWCPQGTGGRFNSASSPFGLDVCYVPLGAGGEDGAREADGAVRVDEKWSRHEACDRDERWPRAGACGCNENGRAGMSVAVPRAVARRSAWRRRVWPRAGARGYEEVSRVLAHVDYGEAVARRRVWLPGNRPRASVRGCAEGGRALARVAAAKRLRDEQA